MSKHTPGPWDTLGAWGLEIRPESPARGDTIGFAPIAKVIGDKRLMDESEREANARLIAAAPELLEALIWMVENDDTNEGDTPLPDHNGLSWNEINEYWIGGLNRARAAIAKATGEQP